MPFYTVKTFKDGRWLGDFGLDAVSRVAAVRIANEHAGLKGWAPDCWAVYRNANMNNATYYEKVSGRYRAAIRM